MTKVLHFSFDYAEQYSDDNIGKSTTVISDFIKATSEFTENHIISLTRTVNPFSESSKLITSKHSHITSWGLPFGLFLKSSMIRFHKKVLTFPEKKYLQFDDIDIIHCHKLTFEGIIGYNLAKELNKKLFVSIRQTDFFVLKYRADLKTFYKVILQYSSKIFFIAPFMKTKLLEVFGDEFYNEVLKEKIIFLPNKIEMRNFSFNNNSRTGNFITILWMNKKAIKRKNVFNLFRAIKILDDQSFKLDVIGGGDYLNSVKKWSKDLGIENKINFIGFKKNDELEEYFNNAKGFILPSHSESFGVVYAESLVSGTPILYTFGTGFDGLFENVGPKVNSKSVKSIADGIKDITDKNDFYRKEIEKLHNQNAFNIFSKDYSLKVYMAAIKSMLNLLFLTLLV